MFENLREDWQTYGGQLSRQGLWVMCVYRFGRWRYTIRRRWLRLPFSALYKLLKPLSEILTGIELPCEATLGHRFRIDHFGGIIISGDAVFGDDCIVRNGVTIGLRNTGQRGSPVIGNRVDIGAGAKILGPIRIGDDVAIGANAVVLCNVPAGSIAVGIPARVLARKPPLVSTPVSPAGWNDPEIAGQAGAGFPPEVEGRLERGIEWTMNEPLLSVVVIGRNEGQRLKRCLESVASLSGLEGSVQVIYVDSASSDGSPELAERLGAEVVSLHAERPTAALGRNAGLARARAAYVLFLDGDTILHPDFPAAALAALSRDSSTAVVWGHRREIHPERSIYNRILDLDWIYAPGDAEFCGGDALIRRSALQAVQGYDSALIAGEEPELCRRMRARGYRILHIDCPMTGHDLGMTACSQYWRRAVRAGYAYAEVSSRFAATADPFWTAESRRNRLRGGFWISTLAVALLALWVTPWLLAAWAALLVGLSLRSAWRSRWKAPGKSALLAAYGFHSHLQQIPILLGQLQFSRDRRKGRTGKLIEYKEGRSA